MGEIRKHTPEDLDALMNVWETASVQAHSFLKADFVVLVREEMRVRYLPNSETWVYEDKGEIVGFISMVNNEIAGLFILPSTQRKGIGTQLADHVAKLHDELEVEVFEKNEIGRDFYNKYGFKLMYTYHHKQSGETVLRLKISK